MSQPTEKRADELKIGDHVHDTRGRGPIEVAHVGRHRKGQADERVLLVTADAAVSYHFLDEMFAMATDAELAEAEYGRKRAGIVKKIREYADWVEQHTELPPPDAVDLRMQHSMISAKSSDADKLALAGVVAAALGETVETEAQGKGGVVRVRYVVGDRYGDGELAYVLHGFLTEKPATTLDPETPLDALPADLGADHDPATCECDDCVAEAIDEAEASGLIEDAADDANGVEHLAYNPATDRHETGGDEIEFADEGDES